MTDFLVRLFYLRHFWRCAYGLDWFAGQASLMIRLAGQQVWSVGMVMSLKGHIGHIGLCTDKKEIKLSSYTV